MGLSRLVVEDFRALRAVDIAPSDGVNVVYGENGAGKTSLLEAVFCLGRARSFRGGKIERLVARGRPHFLVRGELATSDGRLTVGVRRGWDGTRVRVSGEEVRSLSTLARLFPVQIINGDCLRLLSDGPRMRRAFLNWTVFHVEPSYGDAWIRFEKVLRQRNAALKTGDARLTEAWTAELGRLSAVIDQARLVCLSGLNEFLNHRLRDWLPEEEIELVYRRGWSKDSDLVSVLSSNRDRELEAGFTLHGPHRADLEIRCGGVDGHQVLSGGQQKLLVIALLLAQIELWRLSGEVNPLLLVDDLPAELDAANRSAVVRAVEALNVQAFLTCIRRDAITLSSGSPKWFHVEHGRYSEVV